MAKQFTQFIMNKHVTQDEMNRKERFITMTHNQCERITKDSRHTNLQLQGFHCFKY